MQREGARRGVIAPPATVPPCPRGAALAAVYREDPEAFHAAIRQMLATGGPDDRGVAKRAAWVLGIDLGPLWPKPKALRTRSRRNRRRRPRPIPIEVGVALGLARADGSVPR